MSLLQDFVQSTHYTRKYIPGHILEFDKMIIFILPDRLIPAKIN